MNTVRRFLLCFAMLAVAVVAFPVRDAHAVRVILNTGESVTLEGYTVKVYYKV